MGYYRLHVDGKTEYVQTSHAALKQKQKDHIAAELARGRALSNIEFTWTPVRYQVFDTKTKGV